MEAKYRLQKRGVEVEKPMQQLETVEAEARRLEEQMVHSLDGQFVKIPGYALPIEFDGVAVQEILLMPYVGACIHVPPPPRNQMAFVKLSEPFFCKSFLFISRYGSRAELRSKTRRKSCRSRTGKSPSLPVT